MTHRNATNAVRPPSLVDTFGTGFRVLNQSLVVLLVPLVLDLWLWLGPRVSVRPLVEWVRSFNPAVWDQAREQLGATAGAPSIDLRLAVQLEQQLRLWRPMYILEGASSALRPPNPAVWQIGTVLGLAALVLAINVVIALLTAVYLVPLADAVRGSSRAGSRARHIAGAWMALMGVLGLMLIFLLIVGVPLLALASLLAAVVPAIGYFLGSMLFALIVWAIFSTSFAYDAVVLNNANPVRAMYASLMVVRRYFWGALGFLLLKMFVLAGLGVIWQRLLGSMPGLLVAMATSAYVGAGMAAAHLVFFRDRLLQPAAAPSR